MRVTHRRVNEDQSLKMRRFLFLIVPQRMGLHSRSAHASTPHAGPLGYGGSLSRTLDDAFRKRALSLITYPHAMTLVEYYNVRLDKSPKYHGRLGTFNLTNQPSLPTFVENADVRLDSAWQNAISSRYTGVSITQGAPSALPGSSCITYQACFCFITMSAVA